MECEIIRDLLPLYLDHVCSEKSRQAVEEHLRHCEECRREAEKMSQDIGIDFVENEVQLLEKGKRYIESKAVGELKNRVICIDMVINILLIIVGIYMSLQYAEKMSDNWLNVMVMNTGWVLMTLVPFVVAEILCLIFRVRRKVPFITEILAQCSIVAKLALVFFALILCLFEDPVVLLEQIKETTIL